MNFSSIEKIADAVLYEGFMLYPYRPTALKNRQRWNFGTLYPREYAEAQRPAEAFRFVSEFLMAVDADAKLDLRIRFLQFAPLETEIYSAESTSSVNGGDGWQQAIERSADICGLDVADIGSRPRSIAPKFEVVRSIPELLETTVLRTEVNFLAYVSISATTLADGIYKLRIELENRTPLNTPDDCSRNAALLQSFISAHAILGIEGGRFISLLDPPEHLQQAAAKCQNIGVFPVLAGEESSQNIMICSPIILYDYPQTAPESGGDFFDSTEMDEMLALRVLTLTDEEKQELRGGDDRTRMVLERTESLPHEQLAKLHGAIRGMRPMQEAKP